MNNGWIHLHRKLLDCSIWTDSEPHNRRSAWIDLLLLANHHDKEIVFDGQKMVITRGQYLTSVRKLSERWRWSVNRTLRYLRLLEELEMIHRDSDSKRTLLTVVNYEVYQNTRNTHGDSNGDSNEYTDEYTDGDTDESQYKNIKNDNKNDKEYKKRTFTPPSVEEVKAYCQERNNTINPEAFIDYYASQKWKKANGRPVEDWKACVRTWEKRDKDKPKPTNKFNNFEQRNYDMEELEKRFLGVT